MFWAILITRCGALLSRAVHVDQDMTSEWSADQLPQSSLVQYIVLSVKSANWYS